MTAFCRGPTALALLVLFALLVVRAPSGLAQQYTLTKIPVPDLSSFPPSANVSGAYVIGYGLNNRGEVVGNVGGVIGNAPVQPFIYTQGISHLLPYLTAPEDWATASAINAMGTIAGESENSDVQGNAVIWQNGSISDLGSLYYYTHIGPSPIPAYSSAIAINSTGDAVGVSLGTAGGSATTDTHAVLFSAGTVTDLGTLGGNDSEALGINDSGIIVGDAQTSSTSHAFYYDGTMHDLGVLPGGTAESSATAINFSGMIAGWSYSENGGAAHAVVWTPKSNGDYVIKDLGSLAPLNGDYSRANAINSFDQVVGISDTPQNGQDAFIYINGKMTDLNSLVPNGSSVALHEATAINDVGQIVAYSLNFSTNVRTTYLLTPIPVLNLSATSFSFAQQPVGSSSAAQTVTLTNPGGGPLSFSSISLTGAQADDYSLSKTCSTTLAPETSCTVSVTFKPVSSGVKSAAVTITDNTSGSPQTVRLTGTGFSGNATLSLTPSSITFPATSPGASSSPQSVTVKNTGGATASISLIEITGAQADDYSLTQTCGSTLSSGSSCTVTLVFKPVSAGSKSAALIVNDSAAGSPQSVALKGTGK